MIKHSRVLFVSAEGLSDTFLALPLIEGAISDGSLIITLDERAETILVKKGLPFQPLRSFTEPDSTQRAIDQCNDFADATFLSDDLGPVFAYKGSALWGLMHPYVYWDFELTILLVDGIAVALRKLQPNQVLISLGLREGDLDSMKSRAIAAAVSAITPHAHIEEVRLAGGPGWFERLGRGKLRRLYAAQLAAASRFIVPMMGFLNRKRSMAPSGPSVLFLTYPRGWTKPWYSDIKEDIYITPIVRALREQHPETRILCVDTYYTPSRTNYEYPAPIKYLFNKEIITWLRMCWERARHDTAAPWTTFFKYEDRGVVTQAKAEARRIRNEWTRHRSTSRFSQALSYEGINLAKTLGPSIDRFMQDNLVGVIRRLIGAERMIKAENAICTLTLYETGPYGRAVSRAGSLAGIKTLGLQHGIIHRVHPDYVHRRVSYDAGSEQISISIPRSTLVYGQHVREIIASYTGYPDDAIEVTGQPRYDSLVSLSSDPRQKVRARERLGILANETVLLYLPNGDERDGENEAVISLAEETNYRLLIKLHPSQMGDTLTELAKRSSADITILRKNLEYSILASDIAITKNSTAGLEAMLLQRDLVVLNLSGQPDLIPDAKEGAAAGVYEARNLKKVVKEILDQGPMVERLSEGRRKFLSAQIKTDVPASAVIADIIGAVIDGAN